MEGVTVVDHVLLGRLLSILRDRDTSHRVFRETMTDAALILGYEAMRSLRGEPIEVTTPLETTTGLKLADEVFVVAILRAGLGLVDGFLRLVPEARVGHLGMYRDEEALRPVGYYENIPSGVEDAEVFVVDPMLATGGSSVQAVARLKRAGARRLHFVCLVAAPEGVKALRTAHPDVPITTATIRSSRPVATGVANARIVVARPTSSSTVSPLVRSAIRKPAVSTSEAFPAMISANTAAV
jgi:uracil phosphoribosyltransferase